MCWLRTYHASEWLMKHCFPSNQKHYNFSVFFVRAFSTPARDVVKVPVRDSEFEYCFTGTLWFFWIIDPRCTSEIHLKFFLSQFLSGLADFMMYDSGAASPGRARLSRAQTGRLGYNGGGSYICVICVCVCVCVCVCLCVYMSLQILGMDKAAIVIIGLRACVIRFGTGSICIILCQSLFVDAGSFDRRSLITLFKIDSSGRFELVLTCAVVCCQKRYVFVCNLANICYS